MSKVPSSWTALILLTVVVLLSPCDARAWTVDSRVAMAEYARGIAPPDLARQLERHKKTYREAAGEPLDGAASHEEILASVRARIDHSVGMIEGHRPFVELTRELGLLARELAELNDPLRVSEDDPYEGRYAGDWSLYADSARPRFSVLFYGEARDVRDVAGLELMLERTRARGLDLYPRVTKEYRRTPAADGRRYFDDRSVAYGTAAIAFSHGVSDIAAVLRYIWLRAGGADERAYMPFGADRAALLSPGS